MRTNRKRCNKTQEELAQELRVNASYINRVERGIKSPGGAEFLDRLATCLELSEKERQKLFEVAKLSSFVIRLPAAMPESGFFVMADLLEGICEMSDKQLNLLQLIIGLIKSDAFMPSAAYPAAQRDLNRETEATM